MSNKKKNSNAETNPLLERASSIVEKGVEHILVFGLHSNGLLELATSIDTFDQIHSVLNRALFEVTMAHTKKIREDVEAKNAEEAKVVSE